MSFPIHKVTNMCVPAVAIKAIISVLATETIVPDTVFSIVGSQKTHASPPKFPHLTSCFLRSQHSRRKHTSLWSSDIWPSSILQFVTIDFFAIAITSTYITNKSALATNQLENTHAAHATGAYRAFRPRLVGCTKPDYWQKELRIHSQVPGLDRAEYVVGFRWWMHKSNRARCWYHGWSGWLLCRRSSCTSSRGQNFPRPWWSERAALLRFTVQWTIILYDGRVGLGPIGV